MWLLPHKVLDVEEAWALPGQVDRLDSSHPVTKVLKHKML